MAKSAKPKLHSSKNPIAENVRASMVQLLQIHLGTAVDITYQTKQAHWNVKGMNFIAVHKLFDELHEMTDIEEVVRVSAEHGVEFLPPREG